MTFKVLGISHVGLAPKDPEKLRKFFSVFLQLPHLGDELVVEQKTLTAMFQSYSSGGREEPRLEILVPSPPGDGPIAQFLEKRGSGVHHLALAVDDVVGAISHLKSHNVRMIDEIPRMGAHGTRIAFVHPEATGGILIELVQ